MKKIFYGTAIQGAKDRTERAFVNKTIIETIKNLGYQVISEHTTGTDYEKTAQLLEQSLGPLPPKGEKRSIFIRDRLIELLEGDLTGVVFEVSVPSLGTGIEIAHAYLRPRLGLPEIPVLALYQKNYWPNKLSTMITGITKQKIQHFHLIEYETMEDMKARLAASVGAWKSGVTE